MLHFGRALSRGLNSEHTNTYFISLGAIIPKISYRDIQINASGETPICRMQPDGWIQK